MQTSEETYFRVLLVYHSKLCFNLMNPKLSLSSSAVGELAVFGLVFYIPTFTSTSQMC